jgi:mersacidin/lichenicidin family type 2 lantibiotic
MSYVNVIRAWKDEEYRLSLTEAERALLPQHPAGLVELSEGEMDLVDGGCSCCCSCCHDEELL